MKLIVIVLVATFLIAAGLILGLPYLNQEKGGQGRIEVAPLEYDAGTVSMAEGLVKYTYEIKNAGEGDLKISKIWTSCMCTTAKLRVEERESPEFGMHDNPVFWSEKIVPGQTAYLDVVFDPAYHGPQGTGRIVRAIYLLTDDPQNKTSQVRLIANVTR